MKQVGRVTSCSHLLLLVVCVWIVACLGHVTRIELNGQELSEHDRTALAAEINRRLKPLEMIRDPELNRSRGMSEGPEYEFFVLDRWVTAGVEETRTMRVFMAEDKEDGSISVVVQDVLWPRRTESKRELEQAVKNAILEVLPEEEVKVRMKVHGPITPP